VTTLFVAGALLTVVSLALVLWPLLRRRSTKAMATRADFDLRVYREQLAEIDLDEERGLIGISEADSARTEVKRRMLAAESDASDAERLKHGGRHRLAPIAAIALLLPAAAALLYVELGSPDSQDQPLAERRSRDMLAEHDGSGGAGQAASLDEVVAQLAKRLQSQPNDASGWFLLGRAYLTMERYADARDALRRAFELAPQEPEAAGAYATAEIATADGQINDAARDALRTLLTLDPMSPQARFLLALDRAQQGDFAAAAQGWTDLLAMAPADAPWVATVKEHLDRAAQRAGIDPATVKPSADALALAASASVSGSAAGTAAPLSSAAPAAPDTQAPSGPGPSSADLAAAQQMTPEARQQMIRGMVERLAARLQGEPDDLEGWRRLARAYEVLGETEKARVAQAHVQALEQR
jgi:cytochrome c-type biogenesis protein CcmH